MSSIEKLQKLAKAQQKRSSKQSFKKVGVYLGVEPKEHFSKKKDVEGNSIKDKSGNDVREEKSDGWTYTFNEVGTSKVIKIVLSNHVNVQMLQAYIINGLGYEIRSGNMIFIDEEGKIGLYQ